MEIWKDISGYEGMYQVSDMGNVRSLYRTILFPAYTTKTGEFREASTRTFKGKLLAQGTSKSGHVSVVICKGNSRLVHQLVLEAFVGERPKGWDSMHLNHIPNDNRLVNLRYGTRGENVKMDYETGGRPRTVPINFNRWKHHYD